MSTITRRRLLLTGAVLPLAGAACNPLQRETSIPAKDVSGKIIYKTQVPGEPARLAFDAAMVEFKKAYPQITVEPEYTPTEAVYLTELRAQIAGGTLPDVVQVNWGWSVDFGRDNVLLPLDDLMRRERISADEWFGGQMDYLRLDGKYYGLPVTGHGDLLYYNRDLFQRSGVPLPPTTQTWRWQDVVDTAVRLTQRSSEPQTSQWGMMVTYNMTQALGSTIRQNGGAYTDTLESPTRTVLDAKAQAAIQWLADLRSRHNVVPTEADQQALGGHPFALGKVGLFWGWSVHFYTTLATVKDFWWDVTFVPRGPDGTQFSTAQNNHVSGMKATRYPDAVWKLLYFMSAGEGAKLRSEIQSIPPGHKRIFDDVWMKAQPAVRRQVLKDTHPWAKGLWKGRGLIDWTMATTTALTKAWNGTASVSAAVQEATDKGNQALQAAAR